MRVSVVISTRNRPRLLKSAIESILSNTYPDFDLVIVDQSENNETKNLVEEYIRCDNRIRYIRCLEKGLGIGRNVGIKETKGEIIAMTDDDCVVSQDWIEKIVSFFEMHPDAAIVFGDVIPGESSSSGILCPWYNSANRKYVGVFSMVDILGLGANMAIRKETTNKFGLFDENIGTGAPIPASEDTDFVYRALAAGYTIYDTNSVRVWHNGWRDFQETIRIMKDYRKGDAAFFMKHSRCGDFRALIILVIVVFKTIFYTLYAGLIKPTDKQPIKLPNSLFGKCYFLIFWIFHPFIDTAIGIFKVFKFSVDKNKKVFIKK